MPASDSFWHQARRRMFGAAAPAPAAVDADAALLPGARLGRFRIERLLARGAVGTLYGAIDPDADQAVAIKVLPLHGQSDVTLDEARERFLREADAARRLSHPDIVGVLDVGEHAGWGYLVMELLSGSDLVRYTRPSRLLPEPLVLEITARVAEALAHAHDHGVVHRDIKPANVMVDLPARRVKVTDFGTARLAEGARTRTGFVLGTPAFMSPEQLAGEPIDGRSDLYALGVMLFQLLTGRLPYEGASMGEVLRNIASLPPRDVRELRPELPAALADVVALALEKRRETRYADGRQLAADLRLIAAPYDNAQSVTPCRDGAP